MSSLSSATEAPSSYPPGTHHIPPPRPASPATAGYRLNHLMLRISDPAASLKFYNDFLGLHTIFIFNTGAWTIYYLGPRSVSIADLGTAQGLLELYYMPSKEGEEKPRYRNGNEQDGLGMGFGHLGFTVPDVERALERAREMGIKILKPLGDDRAETMGVEGLGKGESVVEGYKFVFRQLAFVSDPDGYWVELVPQHVVPPTVEV